MSTLTGKLTGSAGSATFSGSFSVKPVLGCNKGEFATMDAAISPAMRGYRGYMYPQSQVPAVWPGPDAGPVPSGVLLPSISVAAPYLTGTTPDVAGVISGKYDAALVAWFKLVPAAALVTLGHEYEANYQAPVYGWTPAQIKAMHEHVYPLFKENAAPGARYGQCFSSWSGYTASSSYPLTQWVLPGLDYYAVDGYQDAAVPTVAGVFGACATQIAAAQPNPQLAVFEVNSAVPATRAEFFTQSWAWAKSEGCLTFNAFWAASGTYGWSASDTATIEALSSIAAGQ